MNYYDPHRLSVQKPRTWNDIQQMIDAGCFSPLENKAWGITMHALGHERRWNGDDCSAHTYHVAFSDPALDEEQRVMGILHDVPEDSDYGLAELRCDGFSLRIVRGINAMTKRTGVEWQPRGKEPYFDFTERCSLNPDGLVLKPIDIESNMNEGGMTPKKQYTYPVARGYMSSVKNLKRSAGSSIWRYVSEERPDLLCNPGFITEVRSKNRSSKRIPRAGANLLADLRPRS